MPPKHPLSFAFIVQWQEQSEHMFSSSLFNRYCGLLIRSLHVWGNYGEIHVCNVAVSNTDRKLMQCSTPQFSGMSHRMYMHLCVSVHVCVHLCVCVCVRVSAWVFAGAFICSQEDLRHQRLKNKIHMYVHFYHPTNVLTVFVFWDLDHYLSSIYQSIYLGTQLVIPRAQRHWLD